MARADWHSNRLLPWQKHNINPLPFHACSILLHAAVTVLVYRLAQRLVAARTNLSDNVRPSKAAASWPTILEPFIAAILFALHPVHTEAVAGIVGQAELLCALLSICAILCYLTAAEGRANSLLAHWGFVAAAILLGWAAALAKEIGITVVSACPTATAFGLQVYLMPSQALLLLSLLALHADGDHDLLRCLAAACGAGAHARKVSSGGRLQSYIWYASPPSTTSNKAAGNG